MPFQFILMLFGFRSFHSLNSYYDFMIFFFVCFFSHQMKNDAITFRTTDDADQCVTYAISLSSSFILSDVFFFFVWPFLFRFNFGKLLLFTFCVPMLPKVTIR